MPFIMYTEVEDIKLPPSWVRVVAQGGPIMAATATVVIAETFKIVLFRPSQMEFP